MLTGIMRLTLICKSVDMGMVGAKIEQKEA